MREVISTNDAPRSIGPFSQAIRAGDLIFVSGQVALDPTTQKVIEGGVATQTEQVLKNIAAVLQAAGSGLHKVVRSGVYLKNMGDFAAMNAVYALHFPTEPPARTTIEVSRLPLDVLVEIDVIAQA